MKSGGRQAGTPNKKTVLLSELGITRYSDLTSKLIYKWVELLESEDQQLRLIALKELSRFIFAKENSIKDTVKTLTGEKIDVFDF